MKAEDPIQPQTLLSTTSLVKTALEQSKLSGLSEMLKNIAQAVDAQGCILWQVAPEANFDADPPTGFLFVLAQWFQNNQGSRLHDLPLYSSETGMAVLSQKSLQVRNVWSDARVYKNDPFLSDASIKTMCSVPIIFLDGNRGAVNLYKNVPNPFTEEEVAQVERLALIIPELYQAIRDKVSLNLIHHLDSLLQEAELCAPKEPLPKEEMKNVFHGICNLITDTFQSLETSIFLEDRLETPGVYELVATTWTRKFKKSAYERDLKQGLTGWVLANAKPVKIFDLAHFERDKESIRSMYLGITWKDSLTIMPAVREFLGLKTNQGLPPLSFMAAPIVMGDKVLGLIRCAVAKEGPYYFADLELSLLTLVATRISHYWNNCLNRREVLEENRSWRGLITSIGELNSFVHSELTKEKPDEHLIFAESLRVTSSVIKGAEIMDIRLLDRETHELYYTQMSGELWSEGTEEEIYQRRNRRFRVSGGSQTSAGAYVFQTGEPFVISDIRKGPYYSETFLDSNSMIIAPIKIKDEVFGVLDIRTVGKRDFPRHAIAVAELLGQQLGLYRYLATVIRELHKTHAQLRESVDVLEHIQNQQTQTFEDLKHQLYSPINQAHTRIELLLRSIFPKGQSLLTDEVIGEKLQLSLFAIRGLCAKARRVAVNTGLFAQFSQEKPIQVSLKHLQSDLLVKMLVEAARDIELISDPRRKIHFYVDRGSFQVLRSQEIGADPELLEQAIMNVLDNASKYSFSNSEVRIYGRLTRTGRFYITVANKGLPVRVEDVQGCTERGWRSELAEWATGEGSGIGLWIVDNIMKAHAGALIITPTTLEGLTEVSLVFPNPKI
jgi:signal transduction histidine kinase